MRSAAPAYSARASKRCAPERGPATAPNGAGSALDLVYNPVGAVPAGAAGGAGSRLQARAEGEVRPGRSTGSTPSPTCRSTASLHAAEGRQLEAYMDRLRGRVQPGRRRGRHVPQPLSASATTAASTTATSTRCSSWPARPRPAAAQHLRFRLRRASPAPHRHRRALLRLHRRRRQLVRRRDGLRIQGVKIFGFAGWSGSGKTTLIEKLIPRFVGAGCACRSSSTRTTRSTSTSRARIPIATAMPAPPRSWSPRRGAGY